MIDYNFRIDRRYRILLHQYTAYLRIGSALLPLGVVKPFMCVPTSSLDLKKYAVYCFAHQLS